MAGAEPEWLRNVTYLPTEQAGSKHENIGENLMAYLQSPGISDEVLLMQDDIFLLGPPVLSRPYALGCSVRQLVTLTASQRRNHDYTLGLLSQMEILEAWGYDVDALPCLDSTHHPLLVNSDELRALMERVAEEFPEHPLGHFKMLLVTVVDTSSTEVVSHLGQSDCVMSMPPGAWAGVLGEQVRKRFPRSSQFEAT